MVGNLAVVVVAAAAAAAVVEQAYECGALGLAVVAVADVARHRG